MLNPDHSASSRGRFHVSEANFWPETREGLAFPERIRILDSTLRKAYFTAGNVVTPSGFVRIAEALVELGVTDTCLNVTWSGDPEPTPQDLALLRTVLDAGLPLRVNVWSDILLGNGRDPLPIDPLDGLRRLVDAGAQFVAPGIVPAPDAEAARRQLDQLDAHLELARSLGVVTTITLAQVGLRDFDELVRVSRHAVAGGAVRLDLMDSTSSMSPDAMRQFIRRFRELVGSDVDVTMHVHDEFGLATAGALAAAAEGAAPDVSVNGMSYRAGFAALEEVVLALEVLYGVDTGLNLDRLAHVSDVVARESGLPVPQLKPLTGSYAHLKHMPGDAAAAIRQGDDAFPPISHGLVPPVMGAHVSWVWGAASSTDLARALAADLGVELTDEDARTVRRELDAAVAAKQNYPRWLVPDEARAIMRRGVRALRGEPFMPSIAQAVHASVPDGALAEAVLAAFEGSEWADLPPHDDVRDAVERGVGALTTGALVDALSGFRRFGDEDDAGARPELSAREEASIEASAGRERAALRAASVAYERRFGFRAVVAAAGLSAAEITALLDRALDRDAVEELARTRAAIVDILAARMAPSPVRAAAHSLTAGDS
jgi:isopropylmalate/homocitrate/citramalate synthase